MDQPDPTFWKKCNACKKTIPYQTLYWVCSVSTCTRKRTGFVFCTVSCWDSHVPMMNHRESWAEERKSPSYQQWILILKEEAEPKKRGPREKKPSEDEERESAPKAGPPKVILRRSGQ